MCSASAPQSCSRLTWQPTGFPSVRAIRAALHVASPRARLRGYLAAAAGAQSARTSPRKSCTWSGSTDDGPTERRRKRPGQRRNQVYGRSSPVTGKAQGYVKCRCDCGSPVVEIIAYDLRKEKNPVRACRDGATIAQIPGGDGVRRP